MPAIAETQNYVKTVMQLYNVLKPPPSLAEQRRQSTARAVTTPPRAAPTPPGGAVGRANMISPLAQTPGLPVYKNP